MYVSKIAGVSAEQGFKFDITESAVRNAHAKVRSVGVAVSCCFMPRT
ncbi:MAG: hypothetical protein KGN33_14345 [Paracoccaceae bacterium]|nr:hypothetical protein [Paracoccaceae bacterium]